MKVDVECFGYNNLQDFKFMKDVVKIAVISSNIHRYFNIFHSPEEVYYNRIIQSRLS